MNLAVSTLNFIRSSSINKEKRLLQHSMNLLGGGESPLCMIGRFCMKMSMDCSV